MHVLQAILAVVVLTGLAWGCSEARREVSLKWVFGGLLLQGLIAAVLLGIPASLGLFLLANRVALALTEATREGTRFVFGYLGGGQTPFAVEESEHLFLLAFQGLPLILVVSALSALLFHWRILPWIVQGMAWLLRRGFSLRAPVGLGAVASVFLGTVEAPLLVRPYLARMSRGELFALMVTGMATVSGSAVFLFATLLAEVVPNVTGHVLTASVLSVPAGLLVAGVLVPFRSAGAPAESARIEVDSRSSVDALTRGTLEGIPLVLNIVALLLTLMALVGLGNALLGLLPHPGGAPLSLERIVGWLMAPLAWLIGIPWKEAPQAGSLLGMKVVLNELIAYLQLADLPTEALSERSRLLLTYALCGFANLSSVGIVIGGLGAILPDRRSEILALGMKSLLGGTLATLMTAAVVGAFL
jgi:CNT family concentrative nucleoside transporter